MNSILSKAEREERQIDVAKSLVEPAFYGGDVTRIEGLWTISLLVPNGNADKPGKVSALTFGAAIEAAMARVVPLRSKADIRRRYRSALRAASLAPF